MYNDFVYNTQQAYYNAMSSWADYLENPNLQNAKKFIDAYKTFDFNYYVSEELFEKALEALTVEWTDIQDNFLNKARDFLRDKLLEIVNLDGTGNVLDAIEALNSYVEAYLQTTGITSTATNRANKIQAEFDAL